MQPYEADDGVCQLSQYEAERQKARGTAQNLLEAAGKAFQSEFCSGVASQLVSLGNSFLTNRVHLYCHIIYAGGELANS